MVGEALGAPNEPAFAAVPGGEDSAWSRFF
jgi:hypothetical protein